jgi:hypothetical protein
MLSTCFKRFHSRAFTLAELTAGLRSHTDDPWLRIIKIQERSLPGKRLAVGRIYALTVVASGAAGMKKYQLVIKEPRGSQRAGMAGAGSREVAFYTRLSDQLPIRVPRLIAAQDAGEWIALELLKPAREPECWNSADYLLAVEQLALLHDRFWNLDEHLENYTWLVRPLDADFKVHMKPAQDGYQRLLKQQSAISGKDPEFMQAIQVLIDHIDQVAANLQTAPYTLLHGDFWPGNVCICKNRQMVTYDWQSAAIGPAVLDLANLVSRSLWAFGSLPISLKEIVSHYRSSLARLNSFTWAEDAWNKHWNCAVLWFFLTGWLSLLCELPEPIVQLRFSQIKKIWLDPVKEAVLQQEWEE